MPSSGQGVPKQFAVILTIASPDDNKVTVPMSEYAVTADEAKQQAIERFDLAKQEGHYVYSDRAVLL